MLASWQTRNHATYNGILGGFLLDCQASKMLRATLELYGRRLYPMVRHHQRLPSIIDTVLAATLVVFDAQSQPAHGNS